MLKIFKKRSQDVRSKLREVLGDYEPPTFSVNVLDVMSMLRDPDSSTDAIARKLEGDPGMHVKVLRTVNSAAFGLSREVSNLHHALSLLGRSRLEAVLLSHAVKQALPVVDAPDFDTARFWQASALRASLARKVAEKLHPHSQVESFTAGLLQDIAVPVLVAAKMDAYAPILKRWRTSDDSMLHAMEQETFSYDHSYVGGLLAEEWGLPRYLVDATTHHHHTGQDQDVEPALRLASLVRDSDVIDSRDAVVAYAVEHYGLDADAWQQIVDDAAEAAIDLK